MKKRELTHWTHNKGYNGLLLFAQALEEGTFHYSYESYKIPALNCHYLCYDILRTSRDIERKILMDGNFVPLAEEFEQMINEDIFIRTSIDEEGVLLFARDKNSRFRDLSKEDIKSKIKRYPEIASFIKDICETENMYLTTLLDIIVSNIFTDNYSYENSVAIYNASRMFITDLVNGGYSKEYIYTTVVDFFFNPSNPVDCSEDTVVSFFNRFTFDEHGYRATFGINQKTCRILNQLEDLTVRKPFPKERKMLNLQRDDDFVVSFNLKSIDAYSAFRSSLEYTNTVVSLHRINQHAGKMFITPKAIIEKENGEAYDEGKLLQSPPNPMKKKGNLSDLHALFEDITLMNKIDPPYSFFRAIALHSGAVESKDISNQLLNLWTIIETLIDTKRDNEDRINTICSILCSVLNRCYLYDNIEQLLRDIKACSDCDVDQIIDKVTYKETDLDNVEKFALLLSVENNSMFLREITDALHDYPLLRYRIEYFADHVFKDSKSIYEYLQRHEKRIRWHIMRIYRNRNMIVHSGAYMPYRDMIVENLHFYVDVLLDTLIEYYHIGLLNHTSIYKNICIEEAEYYVSLGIPLNGNGKQTAIAISEDNALKLIFNGYSGNTVKKAISRVIEDKRKKALNIPSNESNIDELKGNTELVI